tara:strand:+ start:1010 stop:1186 length:177 start_codon:yes stop_codon:yes gene_type:complete
MLFAYEEVEDNELESEYHLILKQFLFSYFIFSSCSSNELRQQLSSKEMGHHGLHLKNE